MIIRQKKNCNRCFALCGGLKTVLSCQLGYRLKAMSYDTHGFTAFGVPLEPCPKPKTIGDFIFAKKNYKPEMFRD